MPEVRLSVGATMGCRHCVRDVTGRLRDVPGVETIAADARGGTVVVAGTMDVADVLAAFAGTGYNPQVVAEPPSAAT
jgi:copper chaperone CopZ